MFRLQLLGKDGYEIRYYDVSDLKERKTMDKEKYTVKGTSYQDIYDSFENLFPEWIKGIKEWAKDGFNSTRRTILVTMKNGIRIRFGCYKEEGNWVWQGFVLPSEKACKKHDIAPFEVENTDKFDLGPATP